MADPIARHLRYLEQWQAGNSIYGRKRALARLADWLGIPLLEATPEQLAAWRESLNLSPSSISTYVSHIRGFYSWALEEDLIPASPAGRIRVPPVPQLLPRPISEEDLARAIAAAPQPVRLMLVLAGWAGLRAKELACLRRSSIRLNADPPALRVAWNATKGWRERDVPVCTYVHREMDLFGLPASGVIFRRADGPGPHLPATVSHDCNDFLHSLGVAETLHCCRHRFATQFLEIDPSLRRLQELLGHADPATTSIYTKVNLRSSAAAVELLPVPALLAA